MSAIDRRSFLAAAGSLPFALPVLPAWLRRMGMPDGGRLDDRVVPADKGLDPAWVRDLYGAGEPTVYRGPTLARVAMPIGGIGAGQVYLTGDGRLAHWAVFGNPRSPGDLLCEFEVAARVDGREETRRLDASGFDAVEFRGEWPFGLVRFGGRARRAFPLEVDLVAWNPKVPLAADPSILPGVVLRYRFRNPGDAPAGAVVRGRLLNAAGCLGDLAGFRATGFGRNRNVGVTEERFAAVHMGKASRLGEPRPTAAPEVFADFEEETWRAWEAEGNAFGRGPARGTLPGQQPVTGFEGRGLVNTYLGGDEPRGRLLSPEFTIRRPYVNFLLGGGSDEGTRVDLLLDGEVVRTARGRRAEHLDPHSWFVGDLFGRRARIAIVDEASGGWGHVNVDRIAFADEPEAGPADEATFCIAAVGEEARCVAAVDAEGKAREGESEPGETFAGVAEIPVEIEPGAVASATFVVAWHTPARITAGRPVGNLYARDHADALAVARALATDLRERESDLLRSALFGSTMPRWLVERLWMPISTLATETVQLWANGRFWGWEGVGCCAGTCTHVWNYEHALARLWPSLDRSVREMQDFGEGFDEATGLVGFRSNRRYAADGQAGTLLKAYRAHLVSADGRFLETNWARIRKALEHLVEREGGEEGLLVGSQHNTYDIDFLGANTFVGALYLAALRAGEEMAKRVGEVETAARWRSIFERGARATMERLFDGEYFVQEGNGRWQYGSGCLSDQMFGQGWAHQLGLGYLLPADAVRSALRSVWKYNWAPAVRPYNRAYPPERWFLGKDDPGLFLCTWPKGGRDAEPVRYRDEVWTGIEYQVAGHMIWEGMLDEALGIVRAIHDRYDGVRRNPWNEIECGDHYARAMASWGCWIALCGFHFDGPAGVLAFAPRLSRDDFRAFFTAAEGWGSIWQKREGSRWTHGIDLAAGRLRLAQLGLEWPEGARPAVTGVRLGGKALEGARLEGVRVRFASEAVLSASGDDRLLVESTT